MKKAYILLTRIFNGTVTMGSHVDIFTSKELAEKTKEVVEKTNGDISPFTIDYKVEEAELYETEEDVPILNKNK